MSWSPSSQAQQPHGRPPAGNDPKTGPRRFVVSAAPVSRYSSRFACRLDCGHTVLTFAYKGKPPRTTGCNECKGRR